MSRYINSFQNNDALETAISSSAISKPYVAYNESTKNVTFNELDYQNMPLTFECFEAGTFTVQSNFLSMFEYSTDNGITWTTPTGSITATVGMKIQFRGNFSNNPQYSSAYPFQTSGGRYNVYGNVMSVVNKDNWKTLKTISSPIGFLFKGMNVVDASNLILPATTLCNYAYANLFYMCKMLTKGPKKLPSTNKIPEYAYNEMFYQCDYLISGPDIMATSASGHSCDNMFSGCKQLKTPPKIMITTADNNWGNYMFSSCNQLTSTPYLRQSNLNSQYMFSNCDNLSIIFTKATNGNSNNFINVPGPGMIFKQNYTTGWYPSNFTVNYTDYSILDSWFK